MSGAKPSSSPPCDLFEVPVEVVSYVNKFVGGNGTGSVELAEMATPGDTVRAVLQRLGERHPQMRKALWQDGKIGSHIEVVVNGSVLGVAHTLDSPLNPGDTIMLLGQYVGG